MHSAISLFDQSKLRGADFHDKQVKNWAAEIGNSCGGLVMRSRRYFSVKELEGMCTITECSMGI